MPRRLEALGKSSMRLSNAAEEVSTAVTRQPGAVAGKRWRSDGAVVENNKYLDCSAIDLANNHCGITSSKTSSAESERSGGGESELFVFLPSIGDLWV